MVQAHQDSREKGTTKPIPPHETENIFSMGPQILKRFYRCTIESTLTGCITACYGNCLASDHEALQRVVQTAQYIPGAKLPAFQDLYTRRCQRKALQIVRLMSDSCQTPEPLIKWLPRLFALPCHPHPLPLFYTAGTLCCYHLCIDTLITLPTCTYYHN